MTEILDLKALWERGVSLKDAWWEFEPFVDRRHIRLLLRDPVNDPEGDPFVAQVIDWAGSSAEQRKWKYNSLQRNGRGGLFLRVYHRELLAIGFRSFPTCSDQAEIVPRHLFFLDEDAGELTPEGVNWAKGELGDSEHRFFDIRVVEAPQPPSVPEPPKVKFGRPRKRDHLKSACEIARGRHPNFCDLSVEQAKLLVEPILKNDLKSPAGFEDGINSETFRRVKNAVCGKASSSK